MRERDDLSAETSEPAAADAPVVDGSRSVPASAVEPLTGAATSIEADDFVASLISAVERRVADDFAAGRLRRPDPDIDEAEDEDEADAASAERPEPKSSEGDAELAPSIEERGPDHVSGSTWFADPDRDSPAVGQPLIEFPPFGEDDDSFDDEEHGAGIYSGPEPGGLSPPARFRLDPRVLGVALALTVLIVAVVLTVLVLSR